jgi:hypothetical protein
MNEAKKRKTKLVEFIVANSDIPKDRVESKGVEDLEMLAETISKLSNKPAFDFSLNAGAFATEKPAGDVPEVEPLMAPVINWKE